VLSRLVEHFVKSRKFAGSIPRDVIEFLINIIPSATQCHWGRVRNYYHENFLSGKAIST